MKTVKIAFYSLLMCLAMQGIIVLTSWVMHKLFDFYFNLQSFTFTMAFGCMWQLCYYEIKKYNKEE